MAKKSATTLLQKLKFELGFSDAFIESIQDGLIILDTDGKLMLVNMAFCEMTGFEKPELLNLKAPFPFWPPELNDEFGKGLKRSLKEGLQGQFESIHMRKGGERFPVLIFVDVIKNTEHKVIAHLALFQDLIEKKKYVANTHESNQDLFSTLKYRRKYFDLLIEKKLFFEMNRALNNISDGIVSLNTDWCYTYVNKKAGELFGAEPSHYVGKHIWTEFPESVGSLFYIKYHRALESQEKQLFEEFYEPYGRWIEHRVYPSSEGLTIYFSDITEKKETETLLSENEKYLNNILNNIGDPMFVKDDQSRLLLVNDAFCSIFGLSKEDIIGKTLAEDVAEEETESFLKIDRQVIETGKENINEETLTVRGGETRIISTKKTRFVNEKGERFLVGIIRDNTERVTAERNLRLAKEFTDHLVMSMQEGLVIADLEGKIILVNDSACDILGYSKKELIGLTQPYPFAKTEDFERITEILKKIEKGSAPSFKLEFIRKNGERFLATFLTGNITNDQGEVIALFGTMMDISEEVKAKKILEENAKLSTKKKNVILELASLVGTDFISSLSQITKLSSETLNVGRVSIWSFNNDKTEIYCEDLYVHENRSHSKGMVLKKEKNPRYFDVLEKKQTLHVKDAQRAGATKQFTEDYLKPNNIKSMLDASITSANGQYGVLCFEHVGNTNRDWTADEQEFAISIASIVSLMVESHEKTIAENQLIVANEELSKANYELNELRNKLEQENVYLRNELDLVFNFEEMVYGSTKFSNVLSEVEKVATTNATVLLLGQSGTGKELLARAIHKIGLRNNKPLIKVNCSAIPRELIESELFGHKKGSFTGAVNDKVGKFELADGGTLFLDEIGELPMDMQPKILRFLQEGEIEVVGGAGLRKLDVRVIAATNRNLKEEIEKKRFREDLYFRLNVFPIEVPPLRKRKEDIPLLVEHFVDKFNKEYNKNIKYVSDTAMEKLLAYEWPGNIRELENLIERASILSSGETLFIPGFESNVQKSMIPIHSKNLSLETVQRNHIISVLEKCDWKISGSDSASELLDLKPSTLRDKMSKLGIKKIK